MKKNFLMMTYNLNETIILFLLVSYECYGIEKEQNIKLIIINKKK